MTSVQRQPPLAVSASRARMRQRSATCSGTTAARIRHASVVSGPVHSIAAASNAPGILSAATTCGETTAAARSLTSAETSPTSITARAFDTAAE